MTLVLEGRARAGADEADVDGVEVVHAPGEGDDTIAAIAKAHFEVIVVTADRELAERAQARSWARPAVDFFAVAFFAVAMGLVL